ncbi:DUF968 domain-containing protein [Frigidibacter sp. MR17.24]|uniref:DUF968 domain-containing protein n=1 Tax=Frigidibacter sp. MR17.24 TaxID=3127345 RepID=UPI003012BFF1
MTAHIGNLAGRPPLGLKADKLEPKGLRRSAPMRTKPKPVTRAKANPDYLAQVRALPCVICAGWGLRQLTPTQAHHPIHDRGSQAKRPDDTAIPLCDGHHQGDWDTSKIAVHREPERWRQEYGPDTDFIEMTRDQLGWTGKETA